MKDKVIVSAVSQRRIWVDRLNAWVESLPGPSWPYYLGAGLLLYLVFTSIHWYAGAYPTGHFDLFHFWYVLEFPYLLWLLGFLNRSAAGAMDQFQPAFKGSKEKFFPLKVLLSHAQPGARWSGLVLAILFATQYFILYGFPLGPSALALLRTSNHPLTYWTFAFTQTLGGYMFGFSFYHIYHQLRTIAGIYSHYARIDIFNPYPLHAFPRQTSRIAVGVLITPFMWTLTNPMSSSAKNPFGLAVALTVAVVALVMFVSPLMGAHRILDTEKRAQLGLIANDLRDAIEKLHQKPARTSSSEHKLAALEKAMLLVEKLPTWPWQAGTLRNFLATILLPLILFLVQRLLARFVGL